MSVDPLQPISSSGQAPPSRRVPPVDRLRRVTREGDRPERESRERRQPSQDRDDEGPPEQGGGHVDVRV